MIPDEALQILLGCDTRVESAPTVSVGDLASELLHARSQLRATPEVGILGALPPVPTGPVIAMFLSPSAAGLVARILKGQPDRFRLAHQAKALEDFAFLYPGHVGKPGAWWTHRVPLPPDWIQAIS